MKKPATLSLAGDRYDVANLYCAREILAHVEDYGGEDAFAVQWARAVLVRLGKVGI